MSYLVQHVVLVNLVLSILFFLLGGGLGLWACRFWVVRKPKKNTFLKFFLPATLSWMSFTAAYAGIVLAFKDTLFWEGFFSPLVDLNVYMIHGVLSFGLLALWQLRKSS